MSFRNLSTAKILDNPLFDIVQAIVIPVQYGTGPFEVELIDTVFVPWQFQQQLQVVALYAELRHLRVHALDLKQFFLEMLGHLLGPLFGLGLGAHLFDLCFMRGPTQFFLDGLHLLLQVIFSLLLVDIAFDLGLYVHFQGKLFMLDGHETQRFPARVPSGH